MPSSFLDIKRGLDPRRSYLIVEGPATGSFEKSLTEFLHVLGPVGGGIHGWKKYRREGKRMLVGELDPGLKDQNLQNLLGVDLPNGIRIYMYDPCSEQSMDR
jgi:hypothetical protein